jgi:hypothetical protein
MALPANVNQEKLSEAALAILGITAFRDRHVVRAWKGMDWDVLDVLYRKGWIDDPKSKAKSVVLTAWVPGWLRISLNDTLECSGPARHAKGEGRPADLAEPGHEDHLTDKVLAHLRHEIAAVTGHEASAVSYFAYSQKYS